MNAACEAHWARVRHGLAIEAALLRADRERRPGHRHIAHLRAVALAVRVPRSSCLDALHLRAAVGTRADHTMVRRAWAEAFYGRKS